MKLSVFYDHVKEASEQTGKSLPLILEEVRSFGIEAVEINLSQLLADEERILSELDAADLGISCIYETYDFGNDPNLEKAYAQVDAAVRNGVGRILVVPGFVSDREAELFCEYKKDYDTLAAFMEDNPKIEGMVWALQEAVRYAKEKNVLVTLEDYDLKTAPYATRNGIKYFMERVPGLKFTIDCGNFAYSDEDAWNGYWTLADYTVHCHCKDRGEEKMPEGSSFKFKKGLAPCPCGEGYIPVDRIVRDLLSSDYGGYFAIEHFGASDQLNYMRKSAAYLHSLAEEKADEKEQIL